MVGRAEKNQVIGTRRRRPLFKNIGPAHLEWRLDKFQAFANPGKVRLQANYNRPVFLDKAPSNSPPAERIQSISPATGKKIDEAFAPYRFTKTGKNRLACAVSSRADIAAADGLEVETPRHWPEFLAASGPVMLEIRLVSSSRSDLGRPKSTPLENKQALRSFISP